MTLSERALALVTIPSVTGHELEIADYLESRARALFPAAAVLRIGNAIVAGECNASKPTILLVGHLDTVPAAKGAPPPHIAGDRIIGRGASDMKGALAVMMAVAESQREHPLAHELVLAMYDREEGPYADSGLGPLLSAVPQLRRAKLAIAMEPTAGAVQMGCVGSLHATATFRGRAAHAARPWQGRNAIHAAGSLLVELEALAPHDVSIGSLKYREVVSATKAMGGAARNVIPDSFALHLNYRFAPGKSEAQARADLAARVGGRAELVFHDSAPSALPCTNNPLVERLVALTGRPAESKQAWTDVAQLSAFGLDAVNFGPGDPALAHQDDEWVSASALSESYEALLQLAGGD